MQKYDIYQVQKYDTNIAIHLYLKGNTKNIKIEKHHVSTEGIGEYFDPTITLYLLNQA